MQEFSHLCLILSAYIDLCISMYCVCKVYVNEEMQTGKLNIYDLHRTIQNSQK